MIRFIARLAVLVPKPRVKPAKRCGGGERTATADPNKPTTAERRTAITWAQRLGQVFNIDIETCAVCGGAVRILSASMNPVSSRRSSHTWMLKGLSPKPRGRRHSGAVRGEEMTQR